MRTIIEPFKIKVVEPIRLTGLDERQAILERAHYNPFLIPAEDVLIDLLSDSGTAAMSAAQWGAMMEGDEAYAGSRSWYRFEETVRDIFGFAHVIPTHQGRAAERILFASTCRPGDVVPSNTHFDTTRANLEYLGAQALDFPIAEGKQPALVHPFKGNMDLDALEDLIRRRRDRVRLVMLTVTNNSGGGQPVSMANIRGASRIARAHGIPLYVDACRFAENAYFIKLREPGYESKSVREIAREMFSHADGCTMSAKKDGLAGMAGRDLNAIAVGLGEVLDEDYLHYRIVSTHYLGSHLADGGVPIVQPPGGHAIYIDARALLEHIPPLEYPGQSLTCELYRAGGIRAVEIGSVMFGRRDPETGAEVPAAMELVRLALPRRVYTQSHIDYVIEATLDVHARRSALRGYRIVYQTPFLRHFTARFQPLG